MATRQNIDFVLRTIEKRNIRFVRLWFTDVLGNLKSFAVCPEDLEEAFEEGIGFDGSAVDGFAPLEQSDMLAFPDPETFQILPWSTVGGAARMFCDIKTPRGESFGGDTRACLSRAFDEAEKKGYFYMVGPEIEYFYFDNPKQPVLLDDAGYFDMTPSDSIRNLRRNTTETLERMSIPVTYSYHAVAPSQNGIMLRYAEARTCADNVITARHVIKQEAYMENMFASFMPKPLQEIPGSAMFLHQSLFDHKGNNLFYGGEDEHGVILSDLAKHYIAGILKYAPEMALITNPTVNSYKRLVPTGQVPIYATWGKRNRSAYVRIPTYKPGKIASTRIEIRTPDPTSNPYLCFAVTLAAGMKGIEDELKLQPETRVAPFNELGEELLSSDIKRLPHNLGEAIAEFEKSELMHEVLGDHIFNFMIEQKKREWEEYSRYVTSWECEHYYAGF